MITKEELFAIVNDHKVFEDSTNKFLLVDENLQILYVNFSPADGEKKRNPGDFLKCQNAVKGYVWLRFSRKQRARTGHLLHETHWRKLSERPCMVPLRARLRHRILF